MSSKGCVTTVASIPAEIPAVALLTPKYFN